MARQSAHSPSLAPSHKSVLFCPSCGHESHVDGDWAVYSTLDGDVYRCPTCHERVTVRGAERETESPVVTSLVARSARLALAWLPCTPDRVPDDGRSRDPHV